MTVFACGACGMAAFDYILPPLKLWFLLSHTWIGLHLILGEFFKVKLPLQSSLATGIVVVAITFSIFSFTGLPAFLLLIPIAAVPFIDALIVRRGARYPVKARRAILIVGAIQVIAISFCAGLTHRILTTRTEAQYLVQWGHTAPGRFRFEQLQAREPQSLEQYRYIVINGNRSCVTESAERIAVVSRDESDIAVLETALRQNSFWMSDMQKDSLKKSLEQLKTRLKK